MAIQAPETRIGERRVLVCFDGDEVAEGSPQADRADVLALPYHALKAVFFLRSWDTRQPRLHGRSSRARRPLPRHDAPLIDLLSEIRGLRGLRGRGQISDVEYERRRSQVLNRF